MRLSPAEIDVLKKTTLQIDSKAKIYLFGSRTDLSQKGGDIDILILSKTLELSDVRTIRLAFFKEFGEQKLDIIVDAPSISKTFTKIILGKAVLL